MKRPFLFTFFLIILSAVSFSTFGQYDYDDEDLRKPKKKDKVEKGPLDDKRFSKKDIYPGGSFGLGFSDYYISVALAPDVTFRVIDRLHIGAGMLYQYTNDRYDKEKYHVYGTKVFPKVFLWNKLFVTLQYQFLNTEVIYNRYTSSEFTRRENFHTIFGGIGYNAMIGQNSYMAIQMLVNLNENLIYPRRQPSISLGFGVGLGR